MPSNCAYTKGLIKPESESTPPSIELKGYFNGGLLVFAPSKEIFKSLINFLHSFDVDSTNFVEQDLLNQFYKGKWVPLPYTYNALKTLRSCHASVWDDKAVRNVHYILSDKPWNREIIDFEQEFKEVKETGDQAEIFLFILSSWWWKVYKGIEFSVEDY